MVKTKDRLKPGRAAVVAATRCEIAGHSQTAARPGPPSAPRRHLLRVGLVPPPPAALGERAAHERAAALSGAAHGWPR